MSETTKDWIIVGAFFAAFVLVTAGEIYWLIQKLSVSAKKALVTVFLSNFLTITLGFLVTFLLFAVLFAVAWDQNTTMPGGEAGAWAAFIVAVAFPVMLMAGTRRLLIAGLRIEQISRPLAYAIVSTLIFFLAVFGLPAIAFLLR